MFHKVKSVIALNDYKLIVIFAEGITKIYDVKPLFNKFDIFNELKEEGLFYECVVDVGGYEQIPPLCVQCWKMWRDRWASPSDGAGVPGGDAG